MSVVDKEQKLDDIAKESYEETELWVDIKKQLQDDIKNRDEVIKDLKIRLEELRELFRDIVRKY